MPKTSPQGRFIYSLSQRSALAYFLVQRYFDLRALYANLRVKAINADASESSTSSDNHTFELTIALLNEIKSVAESKNAGFMIVTTDKWWNGPSGATYADFIRTLQSEEFLVLDVEAMPGFDPAKMVIPDDGHWSREGHEFVADRIKDFIEINQLIDQQLSR